MEKLRIKFKYVNDSDFSVTYKLNKVNGIFNWYPYTEGFSKPFVDEMIECFNANENSLILDPFSGCGTTALSCSFKNIPSLSIEVNPFMHFIGKTKSNSILLDIAKLNGYFEGIQSEFEKNTSVIIPSFLKDKNFFEKENLRKALVIKNIILNEINEQLYQDFFLLHLSSILVKISNMVRAVDLRYKKNKPGIIDVFDIYCEKIKSAIEDLKTYRVTNEVNSIFVNTDICNINSDNSNLKEYFNQIDYFITSPPYLNGTNYDRNTKLEMAFLDLIINDKDLKELRTKMVTAGINSTHTKNEYYLNLDFIEDLIKRVSKNAYDRRIPMMVNGYFQDMSLAIQNIYDLLKKNGKGVIVVGDSQFGGVHIETDLILAKICELIGFEINSIDVVRERRSKNGMKLRESLIFVKK